MHNKSSTAGKLFQGKRVLILQQRGWGINIGHFIAKRFQAEGARLAAITFKPSAHHFHSSQQEVTYDVLFNNDEVMRNPRAFLGNDDYTIEDINSALGIETIWPLVAASRNHVRSYGPHYYYSSKQNVSDDELILYVKACYKYLKKIIEDFQPDVFITPVFSELPHLMLYHLGKKIGLKAVFVADVKVQGLWITPNDPMESSGRFYHRVDELNGGAVSGNTERAETYIREFRKKLKQPTYLKDASLKLSLFKKIRRELAPFRRIFEWYFVPNTRMDCIPNLGVTLDCRPPHILLRDHYVHKQNVHDANHFPYYPFEKLNKFVYFPLQAEPEAVLDVAAPLFTNQLELARVIALSLPGDYTLAVKDHPAMLGFRSRQYLQKLSQTPNVKLIDYRISSQELLVHSSLVLSPNSTSLAEAAFYRKPAIQFGNQGTTLKLPNVIRHTDVGTLVQVINRELSRDLTFPDYERRLKNYVAAAYDTGYALDYINLWERGDTKDREAIWGMYRDAVGHAVGVM